MDPLALTALKVLFDRYKSPEELENVIKKEINRGQIDQIKMKQEISENEETMTKAFTLKRLIKESIGRNENDIETELFIENTETPYELIDDNVEVRDSAVHGKGVFACDDIEKGKVVTYYPAHCLMLNEVKTKDDKEYNSLFSHDNFELDDDYKIKVDSKYAIYGNKNNISNNLLLGHMINDSRNIVIDEENNIEEELKTKITDYMRNSNNNCTKMMNERLGVCYIKTTKEVKKDEELFMSYQPSFWITKEQNEIFLELLRKDVNFNLELRGTIDVMIEKKYLGDKTAFKDIVVYLNNNTEYKELYESTDEEQQTKTQQRQKVIEMRENIKKMISMFNDKSMTLVDNREITQIITTMNDITNELDDNELKELWVKYALTLKQQ